MSEPTRLAKVIPLPVGMLVEFPYWRTEGYRRIVRTARRLQGTAAALLVATAVLFGLASVPPHDVPTVGRGVAPLSCERVDPVRLPDGRVIVASGCHPQ